MRALFIGRFQPFHLGHVEILKNFDFEYVIAIGSAYESYTKENPFTAGERYEMIYEAMNEANIKKFYIVPVPDINRYGVYVKHLADLTPSFDKVITNKKVIREIFEREGYEVISTPLYKRKEYRGEVIRKRIAKKMPWEHLVPKSVANYIKKIKGVERIQAIFNAKDF
ncbi:MAG: nicotinamide-nucleotide adenylyltransferase [Thermoplasmata archaeon]|nr:MAG: nicotinamide-nucleotide adenylyltransferase [Thermoplasmata archaeon]